MSDGPDDHARAMVAQACAMAIQDAVVHLRNVEIVAGAAIGVAQEWQLDGTRNGDPVKIIATAQETIAAAVKNLEAVSAAATKLLADFPRGSMPLSQAGLHASANSARED